MKVEGGRGVVVQGEGGLKTVKQIGRKQTSSRPRTKTHQTSRYPHHFTFPIFYFIFFFCKPNQWSKSSLPVTVARCKLYSHSPSFSQHSKIVAYIRKYIYIFSSKVYKTTFFIQHIMYLKRMQQFLEVVIFVYFHLKSQWSFFRCITYHTSFSTTEMLDKRRRKDGKWH